MREIDQDTFNTVPIAEFQNRDIPPNALLSSYNIQSRDPRWLRFLWAYSLAAGSVWCSVSVRTITQEPPIPTSTASVLWKYDHFIQRFYCEELDAGVRGATVWKNPPLDLGNGEKVTMEMMKNEQQMRIVEHTNARPGKSLVGQLQTKARLSSLEEVTQKHSPSQFVMAESPLI